MEDGIKILGYFGAKKKKLKVSAYLWGVFFLNFWDEDRSVVDWVLAAVLLGQLTAKFLEETLEDGPSALSHLWPAGVLGFWL